jgi:molecular chaperone GrpE (heat shock protein)
VARGWESKSVDESQIDALEKRRPPKEIERTAEQDNLERKRDGFELQRKRVNGQLEACLDDRYRKILSDGLAFLDSQIVEVNHLLSASVK